MEKRTLNDIKKDIIALVEEAEAILGNSVELEVWNSISSNDNPYTTSLPRLISKERHVNFTIKG